MASSYQPDHDAALRAADLTLDPQVADLALNSQAVDRISNVAVGSNEDQEIAGEPLQAIDSIFDALGRAGSE